MSLIIARQKALKAIGQTFFVTEKNGVMQSHQMHGQKWTHKVTANDKEIIVEKAKGGKTTEKRTDKATISQELSKPTYAKTGSGAKRKGSKASSD